MTNTSREVNPIISFPYKNRIMTIGSRIAR
jgi:hypothetical protein